MRIDRQGRKEKFPPKSKRGNTRESNSEEGGREREGGEGGREGTKCGFSLFLFSYFLSSTHTHYSNQAALKRDEAKRKRRRRRTWSQQQQQQQQKRRGKDGT